MSHLQQINYAYEIGEIFQNRNNGILKIVERYIKIIDRHCRGRVYHKRQKRYKYNCLQCGYCGDTSEEDLKYSNKGCPACSGRVAVLGKTDMWTTNPKLARMLKNPHDGYSHTAMSNHSLDWICPNCYNVIKGKMVSNVNKHGLSCPQCNDNISYPNKLIASLLNYYKIPFLTEHEFPWSSNLEDDMVCKTKVYDFYLPEHNIIIEAQGIQHYEQSRRGKRTLEEEQLNDKIKKELAIQNGYMFFDIDCSISDGSYIINNLCSSGVINALNLSLLHSDIEEILLNAEKSYVVECYKMWKMGTSIEKLCEYFKKCIPTIKSYISRGENLITKGEQNGKL